MHFRFLEEPDFAELQALERRIFPGRPEAFYRTAPAALRYYARSGHSFAAVDGERLLGFVLAQAVWQGDRATVLVTRIAAESAEVYAGLLRALIKSAYDANAYEVALLAEPGDRPELDRALADAQLADSGRRLHTRVLGGRGARGETGGVLE
ncbi:DUF1999 domain-containing protein [Oceanithermus profundus]|uniref:N-acetyltransferase domain-containing protein n=1 Tax=Oceanithermus profundus (strain DSM 14977 / NBRC 100410 / VKM B-2274 / 506) TaxID=670487 RepID=E4U4G5_OCEP5|nr:DUF1999 domain-containing protein [Oceanithermus profundus]ADR36368.1 Protein of unknown function DUF1999 [Oceanithermus profundus DSM 14977]